MAWQFEVDQRLGVTVVIFWDRITDTTLEEISCESSTLNLSDDHDRIYYFAPGAILDVSIEAILKHALERHRALLHRGEEERPVWSATVGAPENGERCCQTNLHKSQTARRS